MVVCFAFAPVEDKNKSLDRDEISAFDLINRIFHMASSISDFSAHRKNYSYCYVYGISNVGHWEIKT